MFDFDVVTGPGDLSKIVRPDARRRQELPQPTAAQRNVTSEETKRKPAGGADSPQPQRE